MESPFEVLGIDSDADTREIERAYKRRVKEAHPDHGGSIDEFQRVRSAYEELRNGSRGDRRDAPEEGADDGKARVEYLNYEVVSDRSWDIADDDLFEKAASERLDPEDHGAFLVEPGESILEAAEERGFAWPYACRGGACANCAIAVVEGEVEMPANHVLSEEMVDSGIRLSCISRPVSDELKLIYNVKQLPGLDELRLPPQQFGRTHLDD